MANTAFKPFADVLGHAAAGADLPIYNIRLLLAPAAAFGWTGAAQQLHIGALLQPAAVLSSKANVPLRPTALTGAQPTSSSVTFTVPATAWGDTALLQPAAALTVVEAVRQVALIAPWPAAAALAVVEAIRQTVLITPQTAVGAFGGIAAQIQHDNTELLAAVGALGSSATVVTFDLAETLHAIAALGATATDLNNTLIAPSPFAAGLGVTVTDLTNTLITVQTGIGAFGSIASTFIFDTAELFAAAAALGSTVTANSLIKITVETGVAALGADAPTFIFDLSEILVAAAALGADTGDPVHGAVIGYDSAILIPAGLLLVQETMLDQAQSGYGAAGLFGSAALTYIFDLTETFASTTTALGATTNLKPMLALAGFASAGALTVQELLTTPGLAGLTPLAALGSTVGNLQEQASTLLAAIGAQGAVGNLSPMLALAAMVSTTTALGGAASVFYFDPSELFAATSTFGITTTNLKPMQALAGLSPAALLTVAEVQRELITAGLGGAASLGVQVYPPNVVGAILNAAAALGANTLSQDAAIVGFPGAAILGASVIQTQLIVAGYPAAAIFGASAATFAIDLGETWAAAAGLGASAADVGQAASGLAPSALFGSAAATYLFDTAELLAAAAALKVLATALEQAQSSLGGSSGLLGSTAATFVFDLSEFLAAAGALGATANLKPMLALAGLAPAAILGTPLSQIGLILSGLSGGASLSINLLPPNAIGAIWSAAAAMGSIALSQGAAGVTFPALAALGSDANRVEQAAAVLAGATTLGVNAASFIFDLSEAFAPAASLGVMLTEQQLISTHLTVSPILNIVSSTTVSALLAADFTLTVTEQMQLLLAAALDSQFALSADVIRPIPDLAVSVMTGTVLSVPFLSIIDVYPRSTLSGNCSIFVNSKIWRRPKIYQTPIIVGETSFAIFDADLPPVPKPPPMIPPVVMDRIVGEASFEIGDEDVGLESRPPPMIPPIIMERMVGQSSFVLIDED